MAQGMVNRLAVRGLGAIVLALSTVGGVWMSWLLVMSRCGCTSLMTSGSCVARPGVVGVRHGTDVGTHALARGLAYLQASSEVETISESSGEAEPARQGVG
jgi:hypothetical protein